MLGSVPPIGGAPDKATKDSTEVYGTGAFLLAASEVAKYLKTHPDQSAPVAEGDLALETLRKLRDVVIRDWHRVDMNQNDEPVQTDVFSLWIEHGERPEPATYSYRVLPGVDFDRARKTLDQNSVVILSNTALLQAVQDKSCGMLGAVFYEPGLFPPAPESLSPNRAC